MTTSTYPALVAGWVGQATDFVLLAIAGLIGFAIGYAVVKGSLKFVLKRLHIIA